MRQRLMLLVLAAAGLVAGGILYMKNNGDYEATWPVMGTVAKFKAHGRLEPSEVEAFRRTAAENMERIEKLLSAHLERRHARADA